MVFVSDFPHHNDGSMLTGEDVWVPMCHEPCAMCHVGGTSNIAKNMIIPLADADISIYSLSSYQTDYVLVSKEIKIVFC